MTSQIKAGNVSARPHTEFPELVILNYTPQAQYAREWNPVTVQCRGLIYNTETLEVLARPLAKFFNYGDPDAPQIDPDATVMGVFDKLDGSLGIGYIRPDGRYAIATRGSFHSEQAEWASEWIYQHPGAYYADVCVVRDGGTPLYEIIYPVNRIVVDYGKLEECTYLGRVDKATGRYAPPSYEVGPKGLVHKFDYTTVREALEAPPRDNAEGYVIWLDPLTPVKLKYEDYLALHRVVTGLSRKEIWRQLMGGTLAEYMQMLPDEFHEWADDIAKNLRREYFEKSTEVMVEFQTIDDGAWIGAHQRGLTPASRKDFALKAKDSPNSGYLFSLLNGRDIREAIYKTLEPKGNQPS